LFNFYQANSKFKSKKFPEAIDLYQQCLVLIDTTENKGLTKTISMIYFNMGLAYYHVKDFPAAVE